MALINLIMERLEWKNSGAWGTSPSLHPLDSLTLSSSSSEDNFSSESRWRGGSNYQACNLQFFKKVMTMLSWSFIELRC